MAFAGFPTNLVLEYPVVTVIGPRQAGKTTLWRAPQLLGYLQQGIVVVLAGHGLN